MDSVIAVEDCFDVSDWDPEDSLMVLKFLVRLCNDPTGGLSGLSVWDSSLVETFTGASISSLVFSSVTQFDACMKFRNYFSERFCDFSIPLW